MLLKKYRSRINTFRGKNLVKLSEFTKFKRLFIRLKKTNGKNFSGRITMRYRGGGIFYMYRRVDNLFTKYNVNYKLLGFDRSLYSTGLLSLVKSNNGITKYILSPANFSESNEVFTTFSFIDNNTSLGCSIPLGWIPNNTLIYNLESLPEKGSCLIKAAGVFGKVMSHSNNHVRVMLPSKKIKKFSKYCLASIGRVSNIFHKFQNYGKAGIKRNLNIRPRVCGENMNATDHPNGGRTRGGKPTKNYWGKIIK